MLRFRRIGTTLLVTHLLMALLPLTLLGGLSYTIAASIIKRQSFNQLHAVSDNKRDAITRYFANLNDQIITLAANPLTADAFLAFQSGLAQVAVSDQPVKEPSTSLNVFYEGTFNDEWLRQNPGGQSDAERLLAALSPAGQALQARYIAGNPHPLGQKSALDAVGDGSAYDKAHQRFHPVLRQIQQQFGLYDIFLIDAASGDVVYTVFKEIDFASNVKTGAYADSSLGDVFRRAAAAAIGDTALADFAPYRPSYDAPASFVGTPIVRDGQLVAVLAFQIPIDRINQVMGLRAGMGESGESYLVGQDYLMRSDSFLDPGQHSVVASFRHPEVGKVDTDATRAALGGTSGEGIVIDYNGNPVLSVYAPLTLDGLQWALLSEMDEAEAFAGVLQLRNLTLALGALAALLGGFAATRIASSLAQPILRLCRGVHEVANGSLSADLALGRHDELGQLGNAVEAMQERLRRVIRGDIVALVNAAGDGNLDGSIAEQDKSGFYLELAQALNRLTRINRDFLNDTAHALDAMRRGELDFTQGSNYQGRFAAVQNDIDAMRRTLRQIICEETREVVNAAASGNLAARIVEKGKSGCYLGLAQAVNRLVEINDTIISDTVRITSQLAQGDLDARSDRRYEGSFAILLANVESLQKGLKRVIHDDIRGIVDAASQGDLSSRLDPALQQGFYRSLAVTINELIDTCDRVLGDTSRVMSAMAQGDLSQRIETVYQGDFERLRRDVNHSIDAVGQIVTKIRQTVSAVDNGLQEIASGNMDLSTRTESQAASLEETSAAIEQLTTAVQSTATNANAATEQSMNAVGLAEQGGRVVGDAITAMDKLNVASTRIAEITEVINGIAFQTNLLALNAAVEAARAGEHGHGFAVVANEVRILAGRSSKAAKEIETLIKDSGLRVRESEELVHRSGAVLTDIIGAAHAVSRLLGSMRTATDEQAIGLSEINTAVTQIDQNTQQNSALVEETAAASTALMEQSKELLALVSYFNTGSSHRSAPLRQAA